jgi:hypothetical protein
MLVKVIITAAANPRVSVDLKLEKTCIGQMIAEKGTETLVQAQKNGRAHLGMRDPAV